MIKKPYKTAVVEIAKIIDKHKTEDSERGRMCREIDKIIQYTIFESSNNQKAK